MMRENVCIMTDLVAVSLITGGFSFAAALLGFLNNRMGRHTGRRITQLEKNTNGNTTALVDAAVDAAYHRGVRDGQTSALTRDSD